MRIRLLPQGLVLGSGNPTSAPFPKFVDHCGTSDTNFGNKGALVNLYFQCRFSI
jgi:hypothetical protein